MTPIKTIALKEFKDYFISPIAYIVISLFLIVTGWFFFSTFFIYGRADLRDFFALLPMTFSFFIPAVTMRMFAEEKNV
ncbi:MAG: ABC transporter, partial [Desulfobacter sp.]|nr:ABC transporter [Desulfobacter sp.]